MFPVDKGDKVKDEHQYPGLELDTDAEEGTLAYLLSKNQQLEDRVQLHETWLYLCFCVLLLFGITFVMQGIHEFFVSKDEALRRPALTAPQRDPGPPALPPVKSTGRVL